MIRSLSAIAEEDERFSSREHVSSNRASRTLKAELSFSLLLDRKDEGTTISSISIMTRLINDRSHVYLRYRKSRIFAFHARFLARKNVASLRLSASYIVAIELFTILIPSESKFY